MPNINEIINKIRNDLNNRNFPNEAAVSQGAILPILHALGWDAFDTKTVWPEFSVGGRRVDFALCYPASKPKVFVEVKQVGQADGADKQLFEYAFHEGIPLAVLTDGRIWNFFLPSGQGTYSERKFYVLDILEQDVDESINRFERYLKHEHIKSDLALDYANRDYKDSSHKRQAKATLPEAWMELLKDPNDSIVDILVNKAESISGFTPDRASVIEFIKSRINVQNNAQMTEVKHINQPSSTLVSSSSTTDTSSENHNRWVWSERNAEGYEKSDGFLVKAGALLVNKPKMSLKGSYLDKYNEIRHSELVVEVGKSLKITKDYLFKSKAQATNVLCGHSESANRVWKKR